jgi:hypothetical protein
MERNLPPELYPLKHPSSMEIPMAEARTSNPDFGRAFGEAKKNAAGVAGDAADAAQEVYEQAADSASQVFDSASKAARIRSTVLG